MIIKHYSALEVKCIIPNVPAILIAIAGRPQDFLTVKDGWRDILRLNFDDITRHLEKFVMFNDEQAKQIFDFVLANLDVKVIAINCEAGISRSAAVRVALHEIFNKEFIGNTQPCDLHNKHVYRVLMEVYNKYYTDKFKDV